MSALNDPARLDAVRRTGLLGRDGGEGLDEVVARAAADADAPIAFVSVVGADRQWLPAVQGSLPRDLEIGQSLCAAAIESGAAPYIVNNLTADARWKDMPYVTGDPGARFYAGRPLAAPDGELLGALCVIDTKPRADGERVAGALERLARWAELEVFADASREREAELGKLQDAIIAATAHELRTPLTTIRIHAELLADDSALTEQARESARAIVVAAQKLQSGGELLVQTLRRHAGGAETALRERLQLGGESHR